MKETEFNGLLFSEFKGKRNTYAFIKQNGILKVFLTGKRQIRKAKEILILIKDKSIHGSCLDDKFFTILSVYLCEERLLNYKLLEKELGRFL